MAQLTEKGRMLIGEITQMLLHLSFALTREEGDILRELTGTEKFPKGIDNVSKMKTWAEFRIEQVHAATKQMVDGLTASPQAGNMPPATSTGAGYLNAQGGYEEAPLEEPPEDYTPPPRRPGPPTHLLPPNSSQVSEMASIGTLLSIDQTLKLILAELMKLSSGRG